MEAATASMEDSIASTMKSSTEAIEGFMEVADASKGDQGYGRGVPPLSLVCKLELTRTSDSVPHG